GIVTPVGWPGLASWDGRQEGRRVACGSRGSGQSAGMKTMTFPVRTGSRETVHDITGQCAEFARESSGGGDGLLHVFVPHATAGVALIELGSGSDADVLPAFVAPFATLPVVSGSLALGTWQSVALVDLNQDNPDRHVRLSFLA